MDLPGAAPGSTRDDLTWLPAWRIRDLIAAREVSARAVVRHFLDRIDALNPVLHAFIQVDAEGALAQADAADAAVRRGDPLGPLHGVPVSVKSDYVVRGLARSFAGWKLGVSTTDDISAERLRNAGAIFVGVNSNLGSGGEIALTDEGMAVRKVNWDVEARNPWDVNRAPGWSTSGGAAAAAAALVPVVIGGDGGGSNRVPAAFCGVVGVHPTNNLVPSVYWDKPMISMHGQTRGPMTRTVRDAAMVLQVMAGADGRDPLSMTELPGNYEGGLDLGVEGMRLAWTDDFGYSRKYGTTETDRVIATVRAGVELLVAAGARVEDIEEVWEDPKHSGPTHGEPLVYEVLGGTNTHPMPPTDADAYREAMEFRGRNWDRFRRLYATYDLLLTPTAHRVSPPIQEWTAGWMASPSRAPGAYGSSVLAQTLMFNLLGFPAVSVPCGFVDGLPVGVQISGWPGSEARIFRVAAALERAVGLAGHPPVS